jgi:chorismate mutase
MILTKKFLLLQLRFKIMIKLANLMISISFKPIIRILMQMKIKNMNKTKTHIYLKHNNNLIIHRWKIFQRKNLLKKNLLSFW